MMYIWWAREGLCLGESAGGPAQAPQREDGSGGFATVKFPLVLVLDQELRPFYRVTKLVPCGAS